MTVRINSKEKILAFAEKHNFGPSSFTIHFLPNNETGLHSMHCEVLEDCGKIVRDYYENGPYRSLCLPTWAVTQIIEDADKRDLIILPKI